MAKGFLYADLQSPKSWFVIDGSDIIVKLVLDDGADLL